MSTHTPGPWSYSVFSEHYEKPELNGFAASVFQDDEREDNICSMDHEFDKETTEANARLISAAPDLLAACERAEKFIDAILSFYGQGLGVIHWHQNGDSEPLDNFIDDNSDGKELEAIRAAIAKAKGAQQ